MAQPHLVFNQKPYDVDIWELRDMGALVQSLRSEVDRSRFYS